MQINPNITRNAAIRNVILIDSFKKTQPKNIAKMGLKKEKLATPDVNTIVNTIVNTFRI